MQAPKIISSALLLVGAVTSTAILGVDARAATPAAPEDPDAAARQHLAQASPAALALVDQAEAARSAGDLAQAMILYNRARGAAPTEVAPARGACRVALMLGRDAEARIACERTGMLAGTPEDMRNQVRSIIGAKAPPTMDEMALAAIITEGAVRVAPNQPWGYAARCDMALRANDRATLDTCLADLRRVAPDHPITREMAAAAAAAARPSAWVWLGRVVLALALLGTLAHALAGRRRRGRAQRTTAAAAPAALAVLCALLVSAAARPARAEPQQGGDHLSNYQIDDQHPDLSVPSAQQQMKNPLEFGYLLQDLLVKAEAASKKGDHQAAVRYYAAIAKAVPQRALGFAKTCEEYEAAGDVPKAIFSCRAALTRDGVTVGTYARFVGLLLRQSGSVTADQKKEIDDVIDHLSKQPDIGTTPQQLRCEVAIRMHDVPALESCTKALVAVAPNDAGTISYQWALAMAKQDRSQARSLIDRAEKAGMAKEGLARMQQATRALGGFSLPRPALIVVVGLLAAALGFVAVRRRLARARPGAAT
jgi:tetratricopeptide (TPR) repeat protein